jgi:hypothetical protein
MATTMVKVKEEREPCLCGCGGYPKTRKGKFVPGHDATLKSHILNAWDEKEIYPPGLEYARKNEKWRDVITKLGKNARKYKRRN